MGQRRLERVRGRRHEEGRAEEAEQEEEDSKGVLARINNLTIETGVLEEEAEDGLEAVLGMEVKEDRGGEGG